MAENETITENNNGNSNIRPLLVSDRKTLQRFSAPLRHLLFGFEAQDIPCCLVVPPNSQIESLCWPRIEVIEYPALRFPLFYYQNRRRLFAQIEKFRPTIVHCVGTAKAFLAKRISDTFGIPDVLTVNSSRQNIFKRFVISKGFSSIIASSGRFVQSLKENNPKIAEMIKQINTGTFVDESCACFSSSQKLASMIAVMDLHRFEDIEPLLSAIRHLTVDGYEFVAAIMGRGPAERKIRNFIHSTGLTQTITITPPMKPLRSVLCGTDIFIQPYVMERLDPALIEAASVGTAIATDENNKDDFFQNNTTAIFFDSRDELSIYSALQKLLDDREFARSIACAAQNHLRSNNSVSSMVSDLLKIYSQAAVQTIER